MYSSGVKKTYELGWLAFNGTFSTNRLYGAVSAQKINPTTYPL